MWHVTDRSQEKLDRDVLAHLRIGVDQAEQYVPDLLRRGVRQRTHEGQHGGVEFGILIVKFGILRSLAGRTDYRIACPVAIVLILNQCCQTVLTRDVQLIGI